MSKKSIIMIMMSLGMTIGGFVPWLLGDQDLTSAWPILGGLIGGILGIWLGVKLARNVG